MNTIKFLPANRLLLNKVPYKGYTVGNLPPSFAFIYDANNETEGVTSFFNHKGLTYIKE